MKATLTVTSRGVVTLPARLREALGLKAAVEAKLHTMEGLVAAVLKAVK